MDKKFKWLLTFLAASLVLNIFLIGLEIGEEVKRQGPRHISQPIIFSLKRLSRHMSDEEHEKAHRLVEEKRPILRKNYHMLRDSEKKIRDLVEAPVVDREALSLALHEHGVRLQALHVPLKDVLLEMVEELDFETRKKMSADMFRPYRKKGVRPPAGDDKECKPADHERGK